MSTVKVSTLSLRVTPEFKTLLVQRAQAHHRSLTGYLEWLVFEEVKKSRLTDRNV